MTKALFHLRQFRLLLLVLLCALFSLPLSAQEAYVEKSKDETTLTFYYDNNRSSRNGKTWGIDENIYNFFGSRVSAWAGTYYSPNEVVTKVVFDASFKVFRPTTTENWFYKLSALTTIEGLENLKTSEVTDMSFMFYGCSSLTSLNVSNFNTSSVTNMSDMFAGCSSLTSLNVSNFNTSAVTDMSEIFRYCSSLKELNVSNFNTSSVTNMNGMFSFCSDLRSLNVSNFNTSSVTNMNGMFSFCSDLRSLNVSNFNTSKVTNMVSMFSGCSGLTELNLSNFNTSAVKKMGSMFYGCSSLKRIFNTKTWRCEQSQDMFERCDQLIGAVKYDKSKLDVTMANPETGYFRDPNPKAYVQQSEDKQTLTFYYDNNREERSGKTWGIYEKQKRLFESPAWAGSFSTPNNAVTKVVFDTSFKDFRPTTTEGWFYHLSELTTIEGFKNLNTSAVTNMSWMFFRCSSLTSLNVSNFNTSAVTNMSLMFSGCSGLTSLNLSNFNTSKVTNMSSMFSDCSGLTSLNLSNFNTSAVTDMRYMFSGCSNLTSLNHSNFNTSAVTNMSGLFYKCSSLTSLNLSNFNTSAVTNISEMFYNCSGLKELNVSNFNTSAVTNMSEMFYNCSSLTSLNLSNFNTSAVTDMREMFYNCSGLKELNVSNFNASAVTDMSEMFYDCSRLTELNLSNFNTSAVKKMGSMFYGCSRLKTIFNTQTWRCEQSKDMFDGCTQLKGVVKYDKSKVDVTMANPEAGYFFDPNKKIAYVQQSGDQQTLTFYYDVNIAFRSDETWGINEKSSSSKPAWAGTNSTSNKAVTKVVFDASFKDFKPTTTEGWFYHLSELTTIEGLENLNTSEVTDMSKMFEGCSSLKELNLSNFNTSKVTSMSSMFYGCSSLKELNVSNFNTSKVTSMSSMFYGCSGLKEFNVSNFNTSAVTNMSEMFYNCSGLTSLNLSNFNTSAVWNMRSMFYGCSGLKTILNTQTWRCEQSQDMFRGCTQLKGAVKYDGSKVDATMANPETGYFRDPNPKAYVQQSEDKQTLTFYYDNNRYSRSGKIWLIDEKPSRSKPAWAGTYSTSNKAVKRVVFDASFKDFRPITTEGWFYRLSELTTIEGLKNLNTSAVTDMSGMFYGCSGLTSLNISNFNTSKVTDMDSMFYYCSRLTELNVSNFNTSKVTNMERMFSFCFSLKTIFNTNTWRCEKSQHMFYGCTQLKGAVKYGASEVDVTMANPTTGYFTDPNRNEAYVLQSEDQHTLTFYYDNNRKLRSGKTWDIDEKSSSSKPVWVGTYSASNKVVTKVVFDASFKDFRSTITDGWFYGLSALTTIEGLENLNTSEVTNMSKMFEGCSSLTSLNLSNFNTSKVRNMGSMFSGCSGLKEFNVSNFNTSAVWNMSEMFYGCSGLMSLNVSNFNTSAVTDMRYMFYGCSGLTSLNVSNFNTSKVTDMRGMFTNCSGLKAILNLNTWRCERSQDMFKGCTQLNGAVKYDESKLDVTMANPTTGYFTDPNRKIEAYVLQSKDQHTLTFYYDNNRRLRSSFTWDIDEKNNWSLPAWAGTYKSPNNAVTKVVFDASFKDFRPTTTKGWFYRLSELTTIEGLENLNTSAVTDMSTMFSDCSSLTSLNLSNFNTSAVTNMSEMFSYCSGLKTILNPNTWRCEKSQDMFIGCTQLKGAVKYYASKVDVTMANPTIGYFRDSNKKYLDAYVLQSEDQHTLTFYYDNNRKLRSGKIWDIDVKSSSLIPARAGTEAVGKVVFDASFKDFKPTTTEGWFYHLSEFTTIEGLENLNTSEVTNMSSMFSGCSSLTELNLSNFNTSAVTNMRYMFYGCSGLTELNVSNFNTSAVKDMSGMFSGCSGLTSLNLSNFNTSKVWNMNSMFSGCSGLKRIFNTQTWRCEQSQDMFKGCTQLNGAVEYDASKVNVWMANPTTGYFTDPNRKLEAYVLQGEDQHTLTFYYDNNRKLRSGKTWDIDQKSSSSKPAWAGTNEHPNNVFTKVVFDASFKDFRPTTTEGWFYHLSKLTTIEGLENLNTAAVTDMSSMFSDCSSLTSLNLFNFNTSKVTNMGSMFYGCSGLTSLNVSKFNTSAVTNMSAMFFRCSGLTSLNLSNFNTSKVTNMGRMFDGCSKLTSLNLSNFNTSAITNMIAMFRGCSRLTSLNLSNFNTSKVTNMEGMFRDCSGLKTIINTQTWRCEKSQDMFKGCTQLKGAVKYNASKLDVTMANPSTGYFRDPNKKYLEAYVLQGEDQHTLTFYYDHNRKLRSGKTWDIDEKSSSSEPVWAGTDKSPNNVVTKVVFDASFKDFRPTTTEGWFYLLPELTTIEGLENLNTSAVTNMEGMFSGCSGLTSLNLSNFNTSAVTNMGWMFEGCSSLTSLNVSNFNTSKVTNMSEMFEGCSSLKELNVSNFNTSAVTNMGQMFYGCSGLKELNVSNFNTSAVRDMIRMFYNCSGLKTIFNTQTWRCEQSQDMFDGCKQLRGAVKYDASKLDATMANPTTGYFTDPNRKLEAYVLQSEDQHTLTFYYDNNRKLRSSKTWDIDEKSSDSKPVWAGTHSTANKAVTKVVFDTSFNDFRPTTTEGWFYKLSALTTIEGLENLNTSAVTDMSAMFFRCSGLTSLNLSNFNTSAVTNMGWMFEGCSSLTSLNVSNFNTSKVTNMSEMFEGCSSLKELNVSNFNTSAVTNMGWMFEGCSRLASLNLSNFSTSAVTDMSLIFSGCSDLKELNVSSFNTSAVTDMREMFSGCSSLKELNVSNFNTSAVTDMRYMFSDCSGLKTILNPNTWRCEESQDMFKGCTQLKGAVKYDESKVDATMANPTTGYFSQKLPSAIGRVVFDDNNATQIYNLQGKRVNANQRHLPAGFYIVNGKKVYLNEKP